MYVYLYKNAAYSRQSILYTELTVSKMFLSNVDKPSELKTFCIHKIRSLLVLLSTGKIIGFSHILIIIVNNSDAAVEYLFL